MTTMVSDLPLDEAGLLKVAAKLKQRCGRTDGPSATPPATA